MNSILPDLRREKSGRRKLTAVSLAVATVLQPVTALVAQQVPAGTGPFMPISAELNVDGAVEAELLAADNAALRLATDQFRNGEYEEAAATLSSIRQEDLSTSDRKAYDQLNSRVMEAVAGRKAARADFERGEVLLAQGKLAEAIAAYKKADSKFADKGTHTKALEQIALAEAQRKSAEIADRAIYAEARELLAKGDLDGARTKFQALADRGFKPGLFQRSPADYLAEIAKKQGVAVPEVTSPQAGDSKKAAPETPAVTGPSAKELYAQGVEQFRANDFAAARVSFEAAQAAGYKPGLFERSPADYVKLIDEKLASSSKSVQPPSAPAPSGQTAPANPAPSSPAPANPAPSSPSVRVESVPPAEGSAPAAPAPSGTEAPSAQGTPPAASAPRAEENGAAFYEAGVRQFKEGNLDEAERNFTAARDAGYQAGMFQDSPDRWLKRVADRRQELADAKKAAESQSLAQADRQSSDARKAEARKYYTTGRDLYRQGDWIEARKQFVMAVEAGYKPGLFEDSAQKYLERMDRKEQADAAKAAAAPVPPPSVPAPSEPMAPASPPPVASEPAPSAPAVAQQPEAAPAQPAVTAQELVTQARAAQAAGENDKALELYSRAALIDPNNTQAVAGQGELLAAAAPANRSLLTEQERTIQARRQVVNYNFDLAMGTAREETARGNFAAARQAVQQARAARNTDPTIFTPAEIASFDNQIALAQTNLDTAVRAREIADARAREQDQQTTESAKARDARAERERTVAALITRARALVEEAKYQEALNVVDQILAIDSQNDYAQGVRLLIEDKAVVQQQRRYKEDFGRNVARQFNNATEIQIPYDDLLRFADNWPDISEARDADNAARRGDTAQDQETMQILNKRLPELRFEGVAFSDVIDALHDMTGANMVVEWRALENAGIDRATPVTITRLTNVRFEKALQTILSEVGGGSTPLDFSIDEGVIRISTKELIGQRTSTVVYDVSDLLFRPLDAGEAPEIEFELEPIERGGGGGGGGGDLFGGGGGGGGGQPTQTDQEIIEQLRSTIEELVTSDQWESQGGSGKLRDFRTGSSTSLIVTAPRATHRELDTLLNKLRASQAVQVSVEARFLTISRSFLEDVGLDLDVTLNRGGVLSPRLGSRTGPNGTFTNDLPITQNSSSFTANPRTGLPSALSSLDSATAPALGIQGTFLDDFSVDFLIRATQASVRTSTAQAPRLTMFSGQRARVIVGSYQFFVTDLTPIVGTGAVAFQPEPSAVFSGVQLWVQAVVSADRKFVQLNLVPQLRQLTGVSNFVFQTAADGDGNTGGTGGNLVNPVAGIATATIQLPTQSSTQIYTSASVPDGGTILLGGLTIGGETENEMGVPILSKIPFLKRLFTNRSTAKDESVLLILVKPTIIIHREVEAKTFPLLNKVAP